MKRSILFLGISFFALASTSHAGGGQYQPRNFSHGQQIAGLSFSPEVSVRDYQDANFPPVVGEEFSLNAGGLPGAQCTTTQKISDGDGVVKANCKADSYGMFILTIQPITQNKAKNSATFEVYFTDPSGMSATGYQTQGTQDALYQVAVAPSHVDIYVGNTFTLEAQLSRNGQITTNYDEVDAFLWTVLKGGLTSLSGSAQNRTIQWRADTVGQTVIQTTALMKDGRKINSGSATITVKAYPLPTAAPVVVKVTPSPVTETIMPDVQASSGAENNSEKLAGEVETLKIQIAQQEKKLNLLESVIHELRSYISHLFGAFFK